MLSSPRAFLGANTSARISLIPPTPRERLPHRAAPLVLTNAIVGRVRDAVNGQSALTTGRGFEPCPHPVAIAFPWTYVLCPDVCFCDREVLAPAVPAQGDAVPTPTANREKHDAENRRGQRDPRLGQKRRSQARRNPGRELSRPPAGSRAQEHGVVVKQETPPERLEYSYASGRES